MQSSDGGNRTEADRDLIAAVLSGCPEAIANFIEKISGAVWASCRALSAYEGEARDSFIETMAELRASGFAAFRDYDGRSTLQTFTSLVVRDMHGRRLLQLFGSDAAKAWRMFQQLFDGDIRRLIHRRLSAAEPEDIHRDFYQSVCLALVDQDYRRIQAYSGKGSFSGFILRCIDNLVRDEIRKTMVSRRRFPRWIAQRGDLEREIFRLVYWEGIPARSDLLAQQLRSRLSRDSSCAEIEVALAEVRRHAEQSGCSPQSGEQDEAAEPSPEDVFIQAADDQQLSAALGILTQAVQILPDDERLYLKLMLRDDPPAPREVARIMRRPVEEIYALKQRVLKKLRELLSQDSAVKKWLASV